jgi:hypothetical protein
MQLPHSPSFLRRAVGTAALYIISIPLIALGMLIVFSIVVYDTVERRFRNQSKLQRTVR